MRLKVRKPSIPERLWPPLAAGLLMLVVGAAAYVTSQPFLYPSLGPTAFLQRGKTERGEKKKAK